MANEEHLALLSQGVDVWNEWRKKESLVVPDLSEADLEGTNLDQANLSGANLSGARLGRTSGLWVDVSGADLSGAKLDGAHFRQANFRGADVSRTSLFRTDLDNSDLRDANFSYANFLGTDLTGSDFRGATLRPAMLFGANLTGANLSGVDLRRQNMERAQLIGTNLEGALLNGCRVHGTSVWNVKISEDTRQRDLIITASDEPEVTVDNLEVAQFVYLLLHNEKIRDVIDTIGRKSVLLLGRFTEGRIAVLERLRNELRNRGYLPIVFNFDKPETKDFTETVRLLAGLSKFVIADVTNPKSAPLELQATVPEIMVPFRPIIEEGEKPFAMLQDLWIKHRDWVFEPIYYSSIDALVRSLDEKIIRPAEARFAELLARKAETMKGDHV